MGARGVQLIEVALLIHVLPLPIALLDLTMAKGAKELFEAVSFFRTMGLVLFYVFFYISVIVGNYKLTKLWPYSFMKDFGTDLKKWTAFVVTQSGVMSVFVCAN